MLPAHLRENKNPTTKPCGHQEVGQRSRFITPAPPAPDPDARPIASVNDTACKDFSLLEFLPYEQEIKPESDKSPDGVATDSEVLRAGSSMALATLFSRITGFLRTVVIGAALGPAIASAFNTANTLPNLITEIVLGAVLTSLVVPVLVRAEKEDPDRGSAFIRRLLTLAVTLLGVVTLIAVITAPLLTRVMLENDGEVNVVMSVSFAYLLLPQIFFYGLFALLAAVLNTRGVFAPGAWAPVMNNLLTLAVFGLYWLIPSNLDPDAAVEVLDTHVLLLGLGTTAGVVCQALIMIPYLRRAGISIRPLWGIDNRLKQFGGMGLAIIVYVAISQLGYVITTRIASGVDDAALTIYQQHWQLLQMPYGIIGVALLTAIMPRLSRNAADGDDTAVVADLRMATNLILTALIPIVIFITAFGVPIATGLFAYGKFDVMTASILGWTLSFSAFSLIPYALVLLHLRVFYAREEAWTPTFIIGGITATKTALSLIAPGIASSPDRVVILLGAANGFGFIAGAIIGIYLLKRKLGLMGLRSALKTSLWAIGASLLGITLAGIVGYLLNAFLGDVLDDLKSPGQLIYVAVVGIAFLVGTSFVLVRSDLEDISVFKRAFSRVPGIRQKTPSTAEVRSETPLNIETISELQSFNEFDANPVPPPLSAGVVRGPRLIPGAPVSDGRFRLLAKQGSVSGAQFWQALEQSTGRQVALTFVDTSGPAPFMPLSFEESAYKATEIKQLTLQLSDLDSPVIASQVEVVAYPQGCLIVSEWVSGSSFDDVCSVGANPYAACYALSDLVTAVGHAHAAGITLGLDNKARLRISAKGKVVLAFPVVLPGSSFTRDIDSVLAAISLLLGDGPNTGEISKVRKQVYDLAIRLKADDGNSANSLQELSTVLKRAGLSGTATSDLVGEEQEIEQPADRHGFGDSSYSYRKMALIASGVFLTISILATLIGVISGEIGTHTEEAPVRDDISVLSQRSKSFLYNGVRNQE